VVVPELLGFSSVWSKEQQSQGLSGASVVCDRVEVVQLRPWLGGGIGVSTVVYAFSDLVMVLRRCRAGWGRGGRRRRLL